MARNHTIKNTGMQLRKLILNRKEEIMDIVNSLFRTGAVIKVDVHIWSAKKKLNPEDLGIDPNDINEHLVSLGSKWLIPSEEIQQLEGFRTKARIAIDKRSLKFSFGSFVPNESVKPLMDELNSIRDKFNESVESIKSRFDELRHRMVNEWQVEAASIASRRNEPGLVFEVMNRVEAMMPQWNMIEGKFTFVVHEYRDMNRIVEEFVAESAGSIVEQVKMFATKLRERIESNNLSDRNLKPIREFVESVSGSAKVFNNNEIDGILDELNTLVSEGNHIDLVENKNLNDMAKRFFDKVGSIADEKMEEIRRNAVESFTAYSRTIEM